MLINDLPKEIQKLVYKERLNQRKPSVPFTDGLDIYQSSVLEWVSTRDGRDFWKRINSGDFKEFYERYPKPKVVDLKEVEKELFNWLKT